MKPIQYASDLHLELNDHLDESIISPRAPYLALLGDIGDPFTKKYADFLTAISKKFEKVFVLAGNHEFYHHIYEDTLQQIRKVCDENENLVFLENDVHELDDIRIVGCTLWSNIDNHASRFIQDYFVIRVDENTYLTRDDTLKLHETSVNFIRGELLRESDKPILVLTHHAPHTKMNGKYEGNELETAFFTDLSYLLIEDIVVGWLSGHTHQNIETAVNGIPLRANCYGYNSRESSTFSRAKIFEIQKN